MQKKLRKKNDQFTYKEQLEPLRDKRIVFIGARQLSKLSTQMAHHEYQHRLAA
jgi:hypothetical protein